MFYSRTFCGCVSCLSKKTKKQKNPNCTEKCTAINCFCFEVSFNTHLAGIVVKMLVSTHRWKSTRLLNAISLSVLITVSRIWTGQGWTLPPHSSPVVRPTPPEPSCLPCLLLFPSLSPARCACSVEDLVTPLLTAAVRLSYQLHWVTDALSILPQGLSAIFLVITPSTTTNTHPKFLLRLPGTTTPYDCFFLIDWIVHTLQFLAVKMFFSVRVRTKSSV